MQQGNRRGAAPNHHCHGVSDWLFPNPRSCAVRAPPRMVSCADTKASEMRPHVDLLTIPGLFVTTLPYLRVYTCISLVARIRDRRLNV